jgi:hypothetical protein
MNRRNFFAFLPVAPVALMADGAKASTNEGAPISTAVQIVLSGNKKPDPNRCPTTLGFNMAQADPSKNLSMAVGDDGHLWLKTKNGEWKRVVTE